ncbi:MAG: response regulator [Flavobacteriaceae bacterium]|nr:response regulator [Flavobacteriaceae bacterium]
MEEAVKILIVEDEYITAKTLSNFLEASGYTVVGCAMDTDEAISYLEKTVIDCVVLDINLNDEKDGVWIAKHIKENYHIPFVFLTAYTDKETISRAVRASPFGFLAKPFQKVELFSAIEIALHKHNELTIFKKDSIANEGNQSKTVFLKNVDRFDKVVVNDICFIESQKNYLLIYTSKMVYKHRATLKEFIEMLPSMDFIKTHRAFSINRNKIVSVDKSNHMINILNNNIPISKAFRLEVYKKIDFN